MQCRIAVITDPGIFWVFLGFLDFSYLQGDAHRCLLPGFTFVQCMGMKLRLSNC